MLPSIMNLLLYMSFLAEIESKTTEQALKRERRGLLYVMLKMIK